MTFSSPIGLRRVHAGWLGGVLLACVPVQAALARQSAPPPPPPTVIVLPPPPNARYQQSMQQQQVRTQLQKNQMQEQLRQQTMDTLRRPGTADPDSRKRLDRADQAQRDAYQSRQDGELQRYQDAVTPHPVILVQPATASSS